MIGFWNFDSNRCLQPVIDDVHNITLNSFVRFYSGQFKCQATPIVFHKDLDYLSSMRSIAV